MIENADNTPSRYASYNANANKQAESTAKEALKNCNGAPPAAEDVPDADVPADADAEDVLEAFEEEVLEAVSLESEVILELVIVAPGEDVVGKVAEGVEITARVESDEVDADIVLADTVLVNAVDARLELELLIEVEELEELEVPEELDELSEPPVMWKGNDD